MLTEIYSCMCTSASAHVLARKRYLQTMQYVLCTSLENSPQPNPIIGRIECKAGHGAGRPTQKMVMVKIFFLLFLFQYLLVLLLFLTMLIQIDEAADRYSFMAKVLDATWNE